VTHRWMYKGRVVSQVPFKVRGPRWRVNSRKDIDPDQVGEWTVTVVDQSGWPLYTEMFRYENGPALLQPLTPAAAEGGPGQEPPASAPEPAASGDGSSR
jgi:hypothetical protein